MGRVRCYDSHTSHFTCTRIHTQQTVQTDDLSATKNRTSFASFLCSRSVCSLMEIFVTFLHGNSSAAQTHLNRSSHSQQSLYALHTKESDRRVSSEVNWKRKYRNETEKWNFTHCSISLHCFSQTTHFASMPSTSSASSSMVVSRRLLSCVDSCWLLSKSFDDAL